MRWTLRFHHGMPTRSFFRLIQALGTLSLWFTCLLITGQVQAADPITPSGLNTQVNLSPTPPAGKMQYDITGGTRAGGGPNLFHSFGEFGVPANNIANFLNESGLATSNILGRVTDGNPSSIFGAIQTTGFGSANLFLMNPSGIVFGPTASLNVGGSVTFTTADYLRLAETNGTTGLFQAAPALPSVFTSGPIAAFGFLGSNPAAIAVQGSTLKMQPGQSISLVGGNQGFNPNTGSTASIPNGVTVMNGAHLLAPGGQVNIASVASSGEVMAGTFEYAPNVNVKSFGELGTIEVSQKSSINVSGNGGGTVLIRGGQFVLNNSKISSNTTGPGSVTNGVESIGGGIDIVVSQDAKIQTGSILNTSVSGNATPGVQYGGVHINAARIEILGDSAFDSDNGPFTGIHSDVALGSTGGNSGPIKLEANSTMVKDFVTLGTFTKGTGNGGDIILQSNGNLELNGTNLSTESFSDSGNAGNIELTSTHGNIFMTNGPVIQSQNFEGGTVGHITMTAPAGEVLLSNIDNFNGAIATLDEGTGEVPGNGGIQITAKDLTIVNSVIQIDNFTSSQPGPLTVNLSGTLSLSGIDLRAHIMTTTRRAAQSADLNITAHDIFLTGKSLISAETFRNGDGGALNIFTQNLELTNGSQITSSSRFNPEPPPGPPEIPSGAGGTVTIQGLAGPAQSVLIDGQNSGIFTNAEGTGPGGAVDLSAQSLTIQNGGTISASTSGTAPSAIGGSITVKTTDHVTMTDGASITVSSTGPGNAGDILINAGQQFDMRDSSVTAKASLASGGNIDIRAVDRVRLVNSEISSSVQGGASTAGGNITIDPNVIVLQNSDITAKAFQGAGGNITLTTPLFLADSTSEVSASSQFGVNGTVTIQNPTSNLSGSLGPLASKPSQAQGLLTQRCAALANGQASSFVVAGREQLPSDPGGWLTSSLPLAALGDSFDAGHAVASAPATMPIVTQDANTVSLRRLTPAWFLMASFADSEATGCHS